MGGGMLLRYLGEHGDQTPIRAGVALAAPLDFPAMGRYLEGHVAARAMNFAMVNGVKMFLAPCFLRSSLKDKVSVGKALRACTLRQLEEAIICPLHGYADAEEYYRRNSPLPVMSRIAVPTLIVNAEDDPVIGMETLPLEEVRKNPNVRMALTRRGGHIGWGRGGLAGTSWADAITARFVKVHVHGPEAARLVQVDLRDHAPVEHMTLQPPMS